MPTRRRDGRVGGLDRKLLSELTGAEAAAESGSVPTSKAYGSESGRL